MDNLSAKWASLGVAFYKDPIQSSPEEAIIDFIKSGEFPEDKKMIGIVLMWLKSYSSLVHVERLKKMSADLNAFELAILGGIAKKVSSWGDSRWKAIEKMISTKNSKNVFFDIGDSQSAYRNFSALIEVGWPHFASELK